jgi:hypothetical protein
VVALSLDVSWWDGVRPKGCVAGESVRFPYQTLYRHPGLGTLASASLAAKLPSGTERMVGDIQGSNVKI